MDEVIEVFARPLGRVAWIQRMLIDWQVLA
jgi:hypothetical protein